MPRSSNFSAKILKSKSKILSVSGMRANCWSALAEVIIHTGPQFPFVICAPTMRVPQNVSKTVNAYLAFRAALRAIRDFNALHGDVIGSVIVPGLCTANGMMPPLRAARQMRAAYDNVVFGLAPNLDISLDAGADSDDRIVVRVSEARVPLISS